MRAASGRSPEDHLMYMGKSFERLSLIASQNPFAWSKKALSAQAIATPTPANRYVGYPYTKSMNANVNVDQSAAVIMTTEDSARSLGIPEDKWVYPVGGADLNDIWYVTRRPCLHESPAIRNASSIALKQANLTLDDIHVFDLYSCFPSAFEIAQREIGIPEDDPRDLSVLGRLEDGKRTLAVIDAGPEELLQMEMVELAGKQGVVRYDKESGRNLARFNAFG